MKSAVNISARIKRHSRILKENLTNRPLLQRRSNYSYRVVVFFVVFMMPIYPVFASLLHDNTVQDFYRGDIDESSIIGSYISDEEYEDGTTGIIEASDSYLQVTTFLNDERDTTGFNEVIEYEVEPGDSISTIAYRFKVSNNSIYWANDFSKNVVIHPGQKIKIPPVSGLIHQVKKGETISAIAKKYEIDEEKIIEQNLLTAEGNLEAGTVLVIPGAVKKYVAPPVPKVTPKTTYAQNTSKTNTSNQSDTGYSFARYASSQYVNQQGVYKLVKRTPQHTFYWGNCTWYVAQYKDVNWGGNAKDWLANARAKGHATGSNPGVGAIVVFHGRGYNPRYGHVGIVMDVKSDHIIVSDMNYRRLNEVTYRKVPKNDRAILGYIYVN